MLRKKTDKPRRKYDNEFKADVLKMVLAGRPVQEIASSLGITTGMIYKWRVSQTSIATGSQTLNPIGGFAVTWADHERVKGRLREVEQERDILKKALGIFSREI